MGILLIFMVLATSFLILGKLFRIVEWLELAMLLYMVSGALLSTLILVQAVIVFEDKKFDHKVKEYYALVEEANPELVVAEKILELEIKELIFGQRHYNNFLIGYFLSRHIGSFELEIKEEF